MTITDCLACVFLSKLYMHLSLGTRYRFHYLSQFNVQMSSFIYMLSLCLVLIVIVGFCFLRPTREVSIRCSVNSDSGNILLWSGWSTHGLYLLWCTEVVHLSQTDCMYGRNWGEILSNSTKQWGRLTWHVNWQFYFFFTRISRILLQYQLCPWEITIAMQAWCISCENCAIVLRIVTLLANW